MTTYHSRPRWLGPRHLLCLRSASHVWFDPDRESSASRPWQTHLLGRLYGFYVSAGASPPVQSLRRILACSVLPLVAQLSLQLHRKQSP
jgi:hypothetical protein